MSVPSRPYALKIEKDYNINPLESFSNDRAVKDNRANDYRERIQIHQSFRYINCDDVYRYIYVFTFNDIIYKI